MNWHNDMLASLLCLLLFLSLHGAALLSNTCLCSRSDGSKLQEDNDSINNEIQAQELAVQDAKAQLHYYECHQHDTNQKVRGCQSSSTKQNLQQHSQRSGHACCILHSDTENIQHNTCPPAFMTVCELCLCIAAYRLQSALFQIWQRLEGVCACAAGGIEEQS